MSSSDGGRRTYRVLVVDDSGLIRSLLHEYISDSGRYVVVGEATTGYEAIRLTHALDPDIITLDLQMPDLGGLDALGYIMSEIPRPVVIISSHTDALADPALQAMLLGAVEFVPKPSSDAAADVRQFRDQLAQALQAAAVARLLKLPERRLLAQRRLAPRRAVAARCAVALAASTGGPRALAELVPDLPAELPAAVLIVQHMPPMFTAALAKRLEATGSLPAREAVDGELLREGRVYVAPGGRHLDLQHTAEGVRVRLTDEPPLWGVRPAADVLFTAMARTFGPASVGVVLTGMGRDGAGGMRAVRDVGGATLVQDEATAVIPSMPRAAAEYAQAALPLHELAAAVAAAAVRQKGVRPA
jgi:two-component system, chemotaxis family, protein-glutamate methylesterase/glutaminase